MANVRENGASIGLLAAQENRGDKMSMVYDFVTSD
jgi:hypothetical protein